VLNFIFSFVNNVKMAADLFAGVSQIKTMSSLEFEDYHCQFFYRTNHFTL